MRKDVPVDKKTFCPYIKGECRVDCMFHYGAQVSVGNGSTVCCALAIQAHYANDMQRDQLTEIINLLDN